MLCFSACELHFGALPTPTLTPTTAPIPVLTVVWAQDGDLFSWREDKPTPLKIASVGVIQPILSPDNRHVAFLRGQQGDRSSLWSVGIDGTGEQQLVKPEALKSLRNGHPQIQQVGWLDNQTVYFNTAQHYESSSVNDDDLYRAALDGSDPQLILPPGAGGNFALSPDGQHIAVVRAGVYDTQKGQVALLDPLALQVNAKLTFTALSVPSEAPFYLPLTWSDDSSFVRVAVPTRENDRVALWRVPVAGEAAIFGYISATLDGLPRWSENRMIALRDGAQGGQELVIADANGENDQVYAVGSLRDARWMPAGSTFVYRQDGALWYRKQGEAPRQLLDASVERVMFVGADQYLYIQSGELRLAHLGDRQPTVIAVVSAATAFDVGIAP